MLSLLPLVETDPDEDGWRFVRRVVYGMEWDGLREIRLPLQLSKCPAPTNDFLTEVTSYE